MDDNLTNSISNINVYSMNFWNESPFLGEGDAAPWRPSCSDHRRSTPGPGGAGKTKPVDTVDALLPVKTGGSKGNVSLAGGFKHFLFSIIYGIIIPIRFLIHIDSSLVGGFKHDFYFPFHIWDNPPTFDEVIFFKIVETTNQ